MVNAQRFRARKVDPKRQLPVYRAADLDDLDDDDNRQTDAIETGVEKDEEAEHHLQAAISATHAAASGEVSAKQVYIPTPDASKVVDGYDALYPEGFTCPNSLIRSSETVEECCAPMYCMDDEDAAWLAALNDERSAAGEPELSADDFELAMDQVESLTCDMVFLRADDIPTVEYLALHAADRDRPFARSVAELVYEHWKARRTQRAFKTVMTGLQFEDTSKTEIDPYVCFRRREVRQGRKTRRADQRSLDQLRRLRSNLTMVAQLLEMCVERENAKAELVAEAQAVARQRAMVIRMRRRLSLTGGSWDELFVPPAQQQQQQRKRLAGRDPLQRPRAAVRKPRIATGLASAAAAAAAAGAAGGSMHSGMLGEPTLPTPFVLPHMVSVHQYPVPRRLQSMASRIQTKTHVCEATLASGWVDATFPGALPLHTNRAIDPPMAGFWAPHSMDAAAAGLLAGPLAEAVARTSMGFRVRRGRLGRLFVDRRPVRAQPRSEDRLLRFRLGLLTPEDHQQLRECRTASWGADTGLAANCGLPEELLRPFSFASELAQSLPTAAASATAAAAVPQRLVPAPLSVAVSSDTAVPTFAGAHAAQTVSPPLSAASSGSAPDSLGTMPPLPESAAMLAAGRLGSSAPPSSSLTTLRSKLPNLSESGPPTPAALSTRRSASVQAVAAAPATNGLHAGVDGMEQDASSSSSLQLGVPMLASSVSTPALAAMSPQVASRSPAAIPNAAKCN
ncbi:Enhancer of polycomb-like protein 1 [Coemansia biformis]|uniref:Enhancer of polycomb-like protein n=1 Tax=Coemansia biformis TaxID=1286918 RepID=A0A9W7YEN4_9FUNG|nr:Enhancer of polycomb-like protein 1 [Coemansia biformis]